MQICSILFSLTRSVSHARGKYWNRIFIHTRKKYLKRLAENSSQKGGISRKVGQVEYTTKFSLHEQSVRLLLLWNPFILIGQLPKETQAFQVLFVNQNRHDYVNCLTATHGKWKQSIYMLWGISDSYALRVITQYRAPCTVCTDRYKALEYC